MKPTLVVLAAGMGSRYGGVKQIDAFGPSGETILDYSVYDAARAGFDDEFIYQEIEKPLQERQLQTIPLSREEAQVAFSLWDQSPLKSKQS